VLAQAELDSKRALSSVAGYHKSAQVGSTAVPLAVAVGPRDLGLTRLLPATIVPLGFNVFVMPVPRRSCQPCLPACRRCLPALRVI
jgi:hypothetical protein